MRLRSRWMAGKKEEREGDCIVWRFSEREMVAFCGVLLELVVWWDISGVLAGCCCAFATYLPLQR